MAVLNADLLPSEIPTYVKRSFKNGRMDRVELPSGMMLFVVTRLQGISTGAGMADFWSPYKRFRHDKGFDARVEALKSLRGEEAKAVFRDQSAFYGKTAGGRYALVAELRRPVIGFMGPIRRQTKTAAQLSAATSAASSGPASARHLIGHQIYIPGLELYRDIVRVKKVDLMAL